MDSIFHLLADGGLATVGKEHRKLISPAGGLAWRCLRSATGMGWADPCLVTVEKGGIGALAALKKETEGEAQARPLLLSLGHRQGTSGTCGRKQRRVGPPLSAVAGSLLSWQGPAIKYCPPWQPHSIVLSDEECRAPGSVLNTS